MREASQDCKRHYTAKQTKRWNSYVTTFSLIKHERVRTYVLISQFSTKSFAVDFRLFLKNC